MKKQLLEGLTFIALFFGGIWAFLFAIGVPGDYSDHRLGAALLVIGLFLLIVVLQKRNEQVKRMIWFFPGDTFQVVSTPGKPGLRKLIGKEFVVEFYGLGSKQIWGRTEGIEQQFCFDYDEIELIGRSKELIELTEKSGKFKH